VTIDLTGVDEVTMPVIRRGQAKMTSATTRDP
jgi:hypothetical protein